MAGLECTGKKSHSTALNSTDIKQIDLVNFTDKYFCHRINNEEISTIAVRHIFCMNEKLTIRPVY